MNPRPPVRRWALRRLSKSVHRLDRLRHAILPEDHLRRLSIPSIHFKSVVSSSGALSLLAVAVLVATCVWSSTSSPNHSVSFAIAPVNDLGTGPATAGGDQLPTIESGVSAADQAMPSPTAGQSVSSQPTALANSTASAANGTNLASSPTPTAEAREEASARSPERVPVPPNASKFQQEFILAAVGPAQQSQRETGVPASVTLAQAALESDWGRSQLAKIGQNYFGIKASAGPGPAGVIDMNTGEYLSGGYTVVSDAFKAYHNMEESFADHGVFLQSRSRYAPCFATTTPQDFARALQKAGYATDPQYAAKLIKLMDTFNLYAYDLPQ